MHPSFIISIKTHSSCEIEKFVETHLCTLCVILRSPVMYIINHSHYSSIIHHQPTAISKSIINHQSTIIHQQPNHQSSITNHCRISYAASWLQPNAISAGLSPRRARAPTLTSPICLDFCFFVCFLHPPYNRAAAASGRPKRAHWTAGAGRECFCSTRSSAWRDPRLTRTRSEGELHHYLFLTLTRN